MPLGSQKVLEHVVIMSSIFVVREQASKQAKPLPPPPLFMHYADCRPARPCMPAGRLQPWPPRALPDLAKLAKTMQQAAPSLHSPPFI